MNGLKETLELLGLTKEELEDRVIGGIVDRCLHSYDLEWDEETGGEYTARHATQFSSHLQKHVKARIDERVQALGDDVVEPTVRRLVDECVLQETNAWGEKKGEPRTFREYLVARAEEYFSTTVDSHGKPVTGYRRGEAGTTTRVAYLVHAHLKYDIERAMKEALENANALIEGGLRLAVDAQLKELAKRLKGGR